MTIKSAALYARVSSKAQAEHGHSLGTQISACKDKAVELGAENIKEYIDDGYSGAYLERPALDSLRDAIHDKIHDAVIVFDPDRLSRNLAHQLLLTEEFEKRGAKLVFVSTEIQDTPEGRMLYQMRGVFAAYEREKFRERSMRGRRSMAKKGLVVQDSYVYGYDFDKENRRYVINEAEAKIIRLIFQLYLSQEVGGLNKISQYLNIHNVPSPQGKLWHISAVRDILMRRMYIGEFYAGRYYHTKTDATHEVRIQRPQSEWIKIEVPAIVTEEEIEKAAVLLEEHKKVIYNHYATAPVILSGLLYCEKCHHRCFVKHGRLNPDGSRARYYHCRKADRFGKMPDCNARMLPTELLDDLVWQAVEEICQSKTRLVQYIGEHRRSGRPKKVRINPAKEIQAKLSRLATERKTVMQWYSKNLIEQSEATEKLQSIRQQEEALKEKLATVKDTDGEERKTLDAEDICREVRECAADYESRRRVLRAVVDKVYAYRTDKSTSLKIPYKISIRIIFKPIT